MVVARIPSSLSGARQPTCGYFEIAALAKPVHDVAVSVTGIDASFSMAALSATDPCPRNAATIARIGTVRSLATRLYYRVPATAFPAAGETISGTIRISSADATPATLDFAVVLRHEPASAFRSGLMWFVGLAVPAFIAAAIGVGSAVVGLAIYWRQKRIDQDLAEQEKFRTYMGTKRADIEFFFNGVYRQFSDRYNKNPGQNAAEWRSDLYKGLQAKEFWDNIPWLSRQALARELSDHSRATPDEIADRLAALFTICGKSIAPLSSIRIAAKKPVTP